jgi:hypothetical protein
LRRTRAILPEQYPRFTLIRQAWGSVTLGLEALKLFVPEVGTIPAAGGLALMAGLMGSSPALGLHCMIGFRVTVAMALPLGGQLCPCWS